MKAAGCKTSRQGLLFITTCRSEPKTHGRISETACFLWFRGLPFKKEGRYGLGNHLCLKTGAGENATYDSNQKLGKLPAESKHPLSHHLGQQTSYLWNMQLRQHASIYTLRHCPRLHLQRLARNAQTWLTPANAGLRTKGREGMYEGGSPAPWKGLWRQ